MSTNHSIILSHYQYCRQVTGSRMPFDKYLNAVMAFLMDTEAMPVDRREQGGFGGPEGLKRALQFGFYGNWYWQKYLPVRKGFASLLDMLNHDGDDESLPTVEVTSTPSTPEGPPWWAVEFKGHLDSGNFERCFNRGLLSDEDVPAIASALYRLDVECGEAKTMGDICKVLNIRVWRSKFHTLDELPDGDIEFLIEGVLPVGINAIGALSGSGKTWFALSLAKALTTGKSFLGIYTVPAKTNVLYLCPEMQAKSFRKRGKRFGIGEGFYCQTISDGPPIRLDDEHLKTAIAELNPVVFLDTAIRFSPADDENSSSQNAKGLATSIFNLIHLGAKSVVLLHHASKAAGSADEMTLENALRGTGDLGAMCDAVWALRYDRGAKKRVDEGDVGLSGGGDTRYVKESRQLVRLQVSCVKGRDFQEPDDFRVQLEPHIDQIGDLGLLADDDVCVTDQERDARPKLEAAILANPKASYRELGAAAGINKNRVPGLAKKLGYEHHDLYGWVKPGDAI